MINNREENYFESEDIARQWISSIENTSVGNRSRENEIYPLLYKWSSELSKNSTIVEIGSGQGICSTKLNLDNKNYIGIEPSLVLANRAKELYFKDVNKKFIVADSYSTKLINKSVDAIFSVGVWFHIENLDSTHLEMTRVLKAGGRILIITGSQDAQKEWESYYDKPKIDGWVILGKVFVPGGYMRKNILYLHPTEKIISSLEKNGFIIDNINELGLGGGERKKGIFIAISAHLKGELKGI